MESLVAEHGLVRLLSSIAGLSNAITATDGYATGTSNNFAVNPGTLDNVVVSPSVVTIIAGGSQAFSAEAFDAYGNSLGDVTGSCTWSINAGAGGSWVQAIGTYTSASSGSWTVTGSYNGVSDTASLTVDPAGAVSLVVSGFADPTVAGLAHDVLVTAKDSFGNTATGYSGEVAVSSSDGSAVLPASGVLSSGLGTFSVTLVTVGEQSISATDTIASSITGTQTGITVIAGGP